jgi:hypothetical protein
MELVEDCAQLCKANSIEGNKKNDITVVYTPASNLKKTGDMEVGQVGCPCVVVKNMWPQNIYLFLNLFFAHQPHFGFKVGFHNSRLVKSIRIETRKNDVINRLNKTKEERFPDLRADRLAYEKEVRSEGKKEGV